MMETRNAKGEASQLEHTGFCAMEKDFNNNYFHIYYQLRLLLNF